jgi:hypothetical protein
MASKLIVKALRHPSDHRISLKASDYVKVTKRYKHRYDVVIKFEPSPPLRAQFLDAPPQSRPVKAGFLQQPYEIAVLAGRPSHDRAMFDFGLTICRIRVASFS